MAQVLKSGILAWTGLGIVGMLFIWTVSAQAQNRSKQPTTQEYASHLNQQLQEAENADPSSRKLVRAFKSWAAWVVVAILVVTLVVIAKVGFKLFAWLFTTSDPEKLAQNDPWVRAHLSPQKDAKNNY